jgi:hypothetical protein
MGLAPSEFYRLLYSELVLILRGNRERAEREARRAHAESAWLGHLILLPYTPKGEKPLTPKQLLARPTKKHKSKTMAFPDSDSAARAFFAAHKAKSNQVVTDGK